MPNHALLATPWGLRRRPQEAPIGERAVNLRGVRGPSRTQQNTTGDEADSMLGQARRAATGLISCFCEMSFLQEKLNHSWRHLVTTRNPRPALSRKLLN